MRTHPGREDLVQRAIISAERQGCAVKVFHGEKVDDYEYNLYCNELKAQVTDGYFFFLDSDDFVIPGAVECIMPSLDPGKANIVQMLRNGRPKPLAWPARPGLIGLPCLVLHSDYKSLADVTAKEVGDYEWIRDVARQIPVNFIPIPLVNAGSRSHGE